LAQRQLFKRYPRERIEDALKRAILLLSIFVKEGDLANYLGVPRSYINYAKKQAWRQLSGEERLDIIIWVHRSWKRIMNFLTNISRKLDLNIGTVVALYHRGIKDPLIEMLNDGEFKLRDWSRRSKMLRGF